MHPQGNSCCYQWGKKWFVGGNKYVITMSCGPLEGHKNCIKICNVFVVLTFHGRGRLEQKCLPEACCWGGGDNGKKIGEPWFKSSSAHGVLDVHE